MWRPKIGEGDLDRQTVTDTDWVEVYKCFETLPNWLFSGPGSLTSLPIPVPVLFPGPSLN